MPRRRRTWAISLALIRWHPARFEGGAGPECRACPGPSAGSESFDTVEEARVALLPADSLAALSAEGRPTRPTKAKRWRCASSWKTASRRVFSAIGHLLVVRRPRGSGALRSAKA